jgi:hypothetical protein
VVTYQSFLRALRDVVPAIVAVLLVLAVVHGGCLRASGLVALLFVLGVGLVAYFVSKRRLPSQPRKAVFWIELRTWGLVGGLCVLFYGLCLYGLFKLAGAVHSDSGKYIFSATSGFVLGALANAFIKPGDSVSWAATRVKDAFTAAYKPYFDPQDGNPRFWSPEGAASHALQDETYHVSGGKPIKGWGLGARRARANCLLAQLGKQETPTDMLQERQSEVESLTAVLKTRNAQVTELKQKIEAEQKAAQ